MEKPTLDRIGIFLNDGLDNYFMPVENPTVTTFWSDSDPYWVQYYTFRVYRNDQVQPLCVMLF